MKTTWPHFGDDEIRAVTRVLKSGRVNQWTGEEVSAFEEEFRKFVGAGYAVAYANGSLALEAAFTCLGLRERSEVVVPSRTFVATAMSLVRCGLQPAFADVDEDGLVTQGTVLAQVNPRTSAISVVHLGGKPAPTYFPVKAPVVEDCAQALGATVDGKHVGTSGKVGVFSFCQDKIMTTGGEGGMVVTDDYMLYRKLWSWKDHGKSYELAHSRSNGQYIWCHTGIGTNARMTEMQAAIGRVQLKKVPGWVLKRRALAERLADRLQGCRGLRVPAVGIGDACYRYYVYTENLQEHWSQDRVISELLKRGVDCGQGACPEVYREQAFYTGLKFCHTARVLCATSLMFKLDPMMNVRYIDRIAIAVRDVMRKACLRSA